MSTIIKSSPTFDNEFNLLIDDLSRLEIKEYTNDKCFIRDRNEPSKIYTSFVLDENSKTRTICKISFYISSKTNKHLPRLIFKKTDLENNDKTTNSPINISFNDSAKSLIFLETYRFLK